MDRREFAAALLLASMLMSCERGCEARQGGDGDGDGSSDPPDEPSNGDGGGGDGSNPPPDSLNEDEAPG